MIKIESITPGAVVSIARNGARQPVFPKQLISYAEEATLEVVGGTVIYSINETEVITKTSKEEPIVEAKPAEPIIKFPAKQATKVSK